MSSHPNRSVTAAIASILHRLPPAAATAALAVGLPLVAPLCDAAAANAADAAAQVGPAQAGTDPAAADNVAPPQIDQSTSLREVVVTGTRFKTPNASSPAPITIVGGADLLHQGTAKVEDLLDSLPQVNAGLMDSDNGVGVLPLTGTATVDLRGIGAFNTLVLMNGRRINPGDSINPSADLHTIPEILIKRVEVETGGASSIYGSDAISGVVNFVIDTHYVGTKLLMQGSGYYYGNGDTTVQSDIRSSGGSTPTGSVFDGGTFNIAGVEGFNFAGGAGHLEVYAGYRHNAGILASSRDFSSCPLTETGPFSLGCQFDGTTPAGQFVDAAGNSWALGTGGSLRPFNATTDGYNPAPVSLLRPDSRYEAGYFGQFRFNRHAEVYLEGTFTHDYTTVFYGGPSGTTPTGAGLNTFGVPCNDPLLSSNEVATLCTANGVGATDVAQIGIGRRNVEAGALEDTFRHTSFRMLAGLKGEINANWTYDGNIQYGKVTAHEKVFNDVSAANVANALDVVSVGGTPTCASVVNGTDPSCVPYNIWGTGPVSAAAVNYITASGAQRGYAQQVVADLQAVGDLGAYGIKSPWARDTFGLAAGADYRDQRISNQPDQAYLTGDLTTQGGARVTLGTYHVSEAFVELKAPLVHGKPGVEDMSLDLSDRYAEYSPQGAANAYGFDVMYAPIRQVRFRGSYSRAIRAPNGHELFLAQSLQQVPILDPCAGPTPTASAAQCGYSGVTGAEYGHIPAATTINQITGGNPNIKPEKANTVTAGVVLTNFSWAPSLLFSVDYWRIKIDGYIGSVPTSLSLASCLSTGNPVFCQLIRRDSSGSLSVGNSLTTSGAVLQTGTNTGSYEESGLDLAGQYILRTRSAGVFTFTFNGSYQIDNTIDVLPGQPIFDCTGLYGPSCTGGGPTSPIPSWRHNLRTTWTRGQFQASLNWRFIGAMTFEGASSSPALNGETVYPVDGHVPNYSYFDLDTGYDFTPHLHLHLGVNNLLGKQPPIIGFNSNPLLINGNLLAGVYDPFGREVFAELSAEF